MPSNRAKRKRISSKITVPKALYYYFQTGDEDQSRFPEYERYNEWIFFSGGVGPELGDYWNTCKDELLSDWIKKNPCTRPWAFWEFEAPEKRNADESEADYLQRYGLLTEVEKGIIQDADE